MTLKAHMSVLDSSTEGKWVEAAFRVAFATTDMSTVNQHFGSTKALAIYAVDMEHTKFLEVFKFGEQDQDGSEDKLSAKLDALEGCISVYSQAVGASAVGQLRAKGVQPVKVSAGAEIEDLLSSLQEELIAGPSAWLAQAIKSNMSVDPSRFDAMENEGWEE